MILTPEDQAALDPGLTQWGLARIQAIHPPLWKVDPDLALALTASSIPTFQLPLVSKGLHGTFPTGLPKGPTYLGPQQSLPALGSPRSGFVPPTFTQQAPRSNEQDFTGALAAGPGTPGVQPPGNSLQHLLGAPLRFLGVASPSEQDHADAQNRWDSLPPEEQKLLADTQHESPENIANAMAAARETYGVGRATVNLPADVADLITKAGADPNALSPEQMRLVHAYTVLFPPEEFNYHGIKSGLLSKFIGEPVSQLATGTAASGDILWSPVTGTVSYAGTYFGWRDYLARHPELQGADRKMPSPFEVYWRTSHPQSPGMSYGIATADAFGVHPGEPGYEQWVTWNSILWGFYASPDILAANIAKGYKLAQVFGGYRDYRNAEAAAAAAGEGERALIARQRADDLLNSVSHSALTRITFDRLAKTSREIIYSPEGFAKSQQILDYLRQGVGPAELARMFDGLDGVSANLLSKARRGNVSDVQQIMLALAQGEGDATYKPLWKQMADVKAALKNIGYHNTDPKVVDRLVLKKEVLDARLGARIGPRFTPMYRLPKTSKLYRAVHEAPVGRAEAAFSRFLNAHWVAPAIGRIADNTARIKALTEEQNLLEARLKAPPVVGPQQQLFTMPDRLQAQILKRLDDIAAKLRPLVAEDGTRQFLSTRQLSPSISKIWDTVWDNRLWVHTSKGTKIPPDALQENLKNLDSYMKYAGVSVAERNRILDLFTQAKDDSAFYRALKKMGQTIEGSPLIETEPRNIGRAKPVEVQLIGGKKVTVLQKTERIIKGANMKVLDPYTKHIASQYFNTLEDAQKFGMIPDDVPLPLGGHMTMPQPVLPLLTPDGATRWTVGGPSEMVSFVSLPDIENVLDAVSYSRKLAERTIESGGKVSRSLTHLGLMSIEFNRGLTRIWRDGVILGRALLGAFQLRVIGEENLRMWAYDQAGAFTSPNEWWGYVKRPEDMYDWFDGRMTGQIEKKIREDWGAGLKQVYKPGDGPLYTEALSGRYAQLHTEPLVRELALSAARGEDPVEHGYQWLMGNQGWETRMAMEDVVHKGETNHLQWLRSPEGGNMGPTEMEGLLPDAKGQPLRVYRGDIHPLEGKPTGAKSGPQNLYGPAIYTSDSTKVTGVGYATRPGTDAALFPNAIEPNVTAGYIRPKRLVKAEEVAPPDVARSLYDHLSREAVGGPANLADLERDTFGDPLATFDDVYKATTNWLLNQGHDPTQVKRMLNDALRASGVDVIEYEGGKRIGGYGEHRAFAILNDEAFHPGFARPLEGGATVDDAWRSYVQRKWLEVEHLTRSDPELLHAMASGVVPNADTAWAAEERARVEAKLARLHNAYYTRGMDDMRVAQRMREYRLQIQALDEELKGGFKEIRTGSSDFEAYLRNRMFNAGPLGTPEIEPPAMVGGFAPKKGGFKAMTIDKRDWLYEHLIQKYDNKYARSPLMKQLWEKEARRLESLGWSPEAARERAAVFAARQTADMLYDLSQRTGAQRFFRGIAPFAPAFQELLETYLWKVPSQFYPGLGHLWLARHVNLWGQAIQMIDQMLGGTGKFDVNSPHEIPLIGPFLSRIPGVGQLTNFTFFPSGLNFISSGGRGSAGGIGGPPLGPLSGAILGQLSKHTSLGLFDALSNFFQPFGPDVQLGPTSFNRIFEAAMGGPSPLELQSAKVQELSYNFRFQTALNQTMLEWGNAHEPKWQDFTKATDPTLMTNAELDRLQAATKAWYSEVHSRAIHRTMAWSATMGIMDMAWPASVGIGDDISNEYALLNQRIFNAVGLSTDATLTAADKDKLAAFRASPAGQKMYNDFIKQFPGSEAYLTPTSVTGLTTKYLREVGDAQRYADYINGAKVPLSDEDRVYLTTYLTSRRERDANIAALEEKYGGTGTPQEVAKKIVQNMAAFNADMLKVQTDWAVYESYIGKQGADIFYNKLVDAKDSKRPQQTLKDDMLLDFLGNMKEVEPLLEEGGIKQAGYSEVQRGVIDKLEADQVQYGIKNDPILQAIVDYKNKVLDPYFSAADVLYRQVDQTPKALQGALFDQIRGLSNSQTAPEGWPTAEEYLWLSKSPEAQRQSLDKWAGRPPEWLTNFQLTQLGYNVTAGAAAFLDGVSQSDQQLQQLGAVAGYSSNAYQDAKAQANMLNESNAGAAGVSQLWQMRTAPPAVRIAMAYSHQKIPVPPQFLQLASMAATDWNTITLAGYSPDGSSDMALGLQAQLFATANQLRTPGSDLDKFFQELEVSLAAAGKAARPKEDLYAAIFFNQWQGADASLFASDTTGQYGPSAGAIGSQLVPGGYGGTSGGSSQSGGITVPGLPGGGGSSGLPSGGGGMGDVGNIPGIGG